MDLSDTMGSKPVVRLHLWQCSYLICQFATVGNQTVLSGSQSGMERRSRRGTDRIATVGAVKTGTFGA